MKIAILVCLGISNVLISGCSSTQQQLDNTPDIAIATPPISVEETIQVAKPKPTVRRVMVVPPPNEPVAATEIIPEPPKSTLKSDWVPNEVHLIRGNELIKGLQKDLARQPTLSEMQQRLQTHMGLSAPQADQVIATLGLQ